MTSGRQSPAEIFYSLVADRRSIRRYEASAVPAETLDRVLAAARWAPSAHNRQPWRFAMLTAFDWKDRLPPPPRGGRPGAPPGGGGGAARPQRAGAPPRPPAAPGATARRARPPRV